MRHFKEKDKESSSNKNMVLWALTGEILTKMVDHISIVCFVYSHASRIIVSGSEDYFNIGD